MNKLFLIKILFLVFILNACNGDNKSEKNRIINLESNEVLEGVKLSVSEYLYQIGDIALAKIGDIYFALITDRSNTPPVHLINVSKDSYISELSRAGRGPGEFAQAFSISVFEDSFIITDPRNYRLTHIPKGVFIDSKIRDHSKYLIDNIQFSGLPLNVLPIDSDNYVVVGPIRTIENHRFTRINLPEETSSYFGSHDSFDSNIDPTTIQLMDREYGTSSNEKSLFATGKYHTDKIDIFNFEGKLIATYKGPSFGKLNFKNNEDRYSLDEENNIIAYVDITSNNDYIYALYSGKKLNHSQRNFGDTIVVIDWSGKFITSFRIDQQALKIAVNGENSLLLVGVQTEEESGLFRYKISE